MSLPVPLHMGALHAYEQVLTVLLAFGPFVVLWLVLRWRRKQDAATEPEPRRDTGRAPVEEAQPEGGVSSDRGPHTGSAR